MLLLQVIEGLIKEDKSYGEEDMFLQRWLSMSQSQKAKG